MTINCMALVIGWTNKQQPEPIMETIIKQHQNESALKCQATLHITLDLFDSQLLKWPSIENDRGKR